MAVLNLAQSANTQTQLTPALTIPCHYEHASKLFMGSTQFALWRVRRDYWKMQREILTVPCNLTALDQAAILKMGKINRCLYPCIICCGSPLEKNTSLILKNV